MSLVLKIIIGIIGLGFLILFHETGHFVVARLCGVTVEAFSVGMGPVLLHHKWGNTDYRLSAIPLGGYCAMKGEKDFVEALEENRNEIGGDKDSFYGTHPFKRLLIAFAGPFFNLIFSYFAFFIIALMGYTYYSASCTVKMSSDVVEGSFSPAKEAGLLTGDTIISIDGNPMNDYSDIQMYLSTKGDKDIIVEVDRQGEKHTFTVHTELDKSSGRGIMGIYSDADTIQKRTYPRHGFFGAIKEGFSQTNTMLVSIIQSIVVLFKGVDLTNAVGGPARITTMLGDTVVDGFSVSFHTGVVSTMELLALISLSLFFTNLLPIPILDGGLILFALIELVTRKKMSPKLLNRIQFAGIIIVGLLLVLAIVGDIGYFIRK